MHRKNTIRRQGRRGSSVLDPAGPAADSGAPTARQWLLDAELFRSLPQGSTVRGTATRRRLVAHRLEISSPITPRDNPDAAWLARGQHRTAARTAARATRVLAAAARMRVPAARSVVVVWGTFPQRVAASGGVTYVASEDLHDWLLGQRPCLKRTELSALRAANVANLFSSESDLERPDSPEARQPAGL